MQVTQTIQKLRNNVVRWCYCGWLIVRMMPNSWAADCFNSSSPSLPSVTLLTDCSSWRHLDSLTTPTRSHAATSASLSAAAADQLKELTLLTASGVVARGGARKGQLPPKFLAVGKMLENLVWKFSSKMQNKAARTPVWGKYKNKIKILSTENYLCWKFATACQHSFINLQCLARRVQVFASFCPLCLLFNSQCHW